MTCPACGGELAEHNPNPYVTKFYCPTCEEEKPTLTTRILRYVFGGRNE